MNVTQAELEELVFDLKSVLKCLIENKTKQNNQKQILNYFPFVHSHIKKQSDILLFFN